MKTALIVCLIISVIVVYVNCHDRACDSDKACASNECCQSQAQVKGKRSVGSGICTRKGTLGSRCFIDGLLEIGNLLLTCPCAHGFQCNIVGPRYPPQGRIGECGPE